MRQLAAVLFGLVALVAAYITGFFVAAGINPGYDFHPLYLALALIPGLIAAASAVAALALAGVRSRRWRVAAPAVVLLAGCALVFATGFASRPDRGADVPRNVALIDELPTYPGARAASTSSSPDSPGGDFAEGFLHQPGPYVTTRVYALPANATVAKVARFYGRALTSRGWRVRPFKEELGGSLELLGRRGKGLLSVDLEPRKNGPPAFSITADHLGNAGCKTRHDVGGW